jgi:hypothetical protein
MTHLVKAVNLLVRQPKIIVTTYMNIIAKMHTELKIEFYRWR